MTQELIELLNYLGRASASPEELKAADALQSQSARIAELEGRLRGLHEALTPSAETKAAYIGEFSFTIAEGMYGQRIIPVPWTTTKEIMAAIIGRAALENSLTKDSTSG